MLSLLFFATAALARVMHSHSAVPEGWTEIRSADPPEAIVLRLALRQQRPKELERAMLEVSTPGHPNYGMHMSREQVRAYTAPTKRAVDQVAGWLQGHGIEGEVENDWITIRTTVDRASELLSSKFAWYQYNKGGAPKLRTLSYSVPDALTEHVDLVQPTTRFGQLGAHKSTIFDMQYVPEELGFVKAAKLAAAAPCTTTVTPACLKEMYKINYTVPAGQTGNSIAFASFLEEYARYKDLTTFQEKYLPEAKGQNFSVTLVNGGKNDQNAREDSGEANLDLQYIMAVAHGVPIMEYSTAGRGPLVPTVNQPEGRNSNEPYLEFLTFVLAQPDSALPQVLSTSYGEEEQSIPPEYALKVCNMFMQLGARGVSVLFSSGDSGPGSTCVRMSDKKPFFEPSFPAGCPFLTSVGATTGSAPEQGVFFSSGGFSEYHERPAYQNAVVPEYLKSIGTTYSAFFNSSNRGFPDVAAQGKSFYVIDKGRLAELSGTSASTPVFAGVVGLLNAARKAQGKGPLGFLNPWLYNNTGILTDITSGAGRGCTSRTYFASPASWNCTKGWDPVTGLGTPDFPKMLEAAAPGTPNA